ncbi:ABC transporter permease subunit [Leptospira santarosai]|uniref:ABC transporter, permease protein n=1 Tax=Leptospira santarosai str. ZUN179 TaxID=1049985 RepID=M6URB3_9LEPT|nr:ABC transporter permease subunit [Leptospira santarosai]EMF88966.1 ABC transporter, permease protein [Leptospira santarosai str. ST188]EMO21939.1 ABC transporter, permease protein [Leptospira santarosai str. HAI134]EMO31867.1 ABC transporter, permease protein [Leptospira santarosai str. HAI821]EMO43564.1 ABC transporter, permease protein [Leptospira santarosai str. ZUN179]EMO70788.1 ABC transporter, permease protein [Leptospira santarosai str. 200403458]
MISFGNLLRILFVFLTLVGILWKSPPTDVFLEDSFCSVTWNHPFGCDRLGRDVYGLFSYGTVSTFLFSLPARLFTLAFSSLICLFQYSVPFTGRWFFTPISSVFVSVPSLLIALLTVHALGQSPFVLVVAILLGDWAFSYETLQSKIRETDGSGFVLASVFFGASRSNVFRSHIFPTALPVLKVLFTTGLPGVVMTLALFSYLGVSAGSDWFGPGLGEQISFARDYAYSAPLALAMPIFGIVGLVAVLNVGKR